MSVTKAPTGLSIARNKLTFTFSWKIADRDYSAGHELQYRTNWTGTGKWNDITIARSATKKTITLDGSEFYPTTEKRLKHITFRVRGKRNPYTETHSNETTTYTPDWSAWVSKTMTFLTPERPDLEAELDSQNANKCTFTWDAEVDNKSNRPFTNVQWQSILKKDCKSTDASKFKWTNSNSGWQAGTGTAEDSEPIIENSVSLANGSWTRWFRVRSRGPRGYSDWRYAKHVYAKPYKAIISSTKATVANNATTVVVNWTVASNAAHPIDSTVVEYLIATPGTGLSVPSGASWSTGATLADTTGNDKAKFTIGSVLGLDQCLWVRIVTKHDVDANDTFSSPKLVSKGKLTTPTNLSVTDINDSTYRATVAATNGSAVPDSKLAICFTKKGWDKPIVIGVLDHGDSSATVQCPSWSSQSDISFSVYAFQGSTSRIQKDSYYKYAITANMKSATVKDGGDVPTAPATLSAEVSDTPGEVILTWAWSWNKADSAEISWSQNPNAWESTDQPSTYTITNVNAAKWRVSGLETGVKWYFRVRLAEASADGTLSYGPYSDNAEVDLSSAPEAPVLVLSAAVAAKKSTITASWGYVSTDNTGQAYAEICKATLTNGVISYGSVIARATTQQHVDISLKGNGWVTGNTYNLCVRVTSASGHVSDWSDLVPIQIADPLVCAITSTSLSTETIPVSDDNPEAYDINVLTEMPLTATITGAGTGGVTTLIIERAAEYHMIRPDDSQTDGYEGETVALIRQDGESQITVSNADLIGALDDGAPYRLIAVIEDGLGQSDSKTIDFTVQWTHQACVPMGTAETDGLIVKITPNSTMAYAYMVSDNGTLTFDADKFIETAELYSYEFTDYQVGYLAGQNSYYITEDGRDIGILPSEWGDIHITSTGNANAVISYRNVTTDTCDIYRLSADPPELIIENGTFGTTYVDPYPAIGDGMGYRIVFKTSNGDYITPDGRPAWLDILPDVPIEEYSIIVDFDGRQLILPYNIALANKWTKDFQLTSYLGGSQQGDWNPGVTRTATYNVLLTEDEDADTIEGMRHLADYHGICHIRTPEGSSYACDIQVTENNAYSDGIIVSYVLTATRVDPEGLDGMTYEEYINDLE